MKTRKPKIGTVTIFGRRITSDRRPASIEQGQVPVLNARRAGGFTLIEALFAAMLIGLVVAAIAVSSGAATMVNGVGLDLSTSEFLISEIRERTATANFDEILTYAGAAYNPPIDINGAAMSEFSGFTQEITVQYVEPDNLTQPAVSPPTDFVRVTVTITKNGKPVNATSWIRARL